MTNPDALTVLFRHHLWANERLFEQCAALTDEQLDTTLLGGYGTIWDTLQHIARAEASYFSRLSTGRPLVRPADAPPLTGDELRQSLRASGQGLIDWANRIGPDDTVDVDWDGRLRSVPKSILLTQAINHATEHRAQIMAALTQVGIEPVEVSGWEYFDANYT